MVRCSPRALQFNREQSARPNHHAIIYRRMVNSRLAVLVLIKSRSKLGHKSLSSHYTKQFSPCLTTPQDSATSIYQVDWTDALGRTASHPSPSCSDPTEVPWPSDNCPGNPRIQLPFASKPSSNRSPHRQLKSFTTHPQQSANTHQVHCFHTFNLPRSTRVS